MTHCERVLEILSDGEPHSHHEFYGFCVLHSRIAELRKRGHEIVCTREGDTYAYRLSLSPSGKAERLGPDGGPDGLSEDGDHRGSATPPKQLGSLDSSGEACLGAKGRDRSYQEDSPDSISLASDDGDCRGGADHVTSCGASPPPGVSDEPDEQLKLEGIAA